MIDQLLKNIEHYHTSGNHHYHMMVELTKALEEEMRDMITYVPPEETFIYDDKEIWIIGKKFRAEYNMEVMRDEAIKISDGELKKAMIQEFVAEFKHDLGTRTLFFPYQLIVPYGAIDSNTFQPSVHFMTRYAAR
jgi:hypothetical protein